jgi:hypothetical protein
MVGELLSADVNEMLTHNAHHCNEPGRFYGHRGSLASNRRLPDANRHMGNNPAKALLRLYVHVKFLGRHAAVTGKPVALARFPETGYAKPAPPAALETT